MSIYNVHGISGPNIPFIIDNCIVAFNNNIKSASRTKPRDLTKGYPKITWGSRVKDNQMIASYLDGTIKYEDLMRIYQIQSLRPRI